MSISISELERALSPARLGPYRTRSASDEEAICFYLWNLALSHELYPLLSSVEVALRNTIHAAATAHFGSAEWFRDPALLAHPWQQQKMVADARDGLWRALGANPRAVPAPALPVVDDHVAALTFGFWTGLLNGPYERLLWNETAGGVNLIPAAFPYAGRAVAHRPDIAKAVNATRRLRNRVSHTEPILWLRPALLTQYTAAIAILGWISPALGTLVQRVDRFRAVHAAGHTSYLSQVTLTP